MAPSGSSVGIEREVLLELCEELVATRALMERLGRDISTLTRQALP
jgi:hypothetical protein